MNNDDYLIGYTPESLFYVRRGNCMSSTGYSAAEALATARWLIERAKGYPPNPVLVEYPVW